METLGHSHVSVTLDTYSHVLPGLQAEAAKRMQEALGCQIGCQDGDDTRGAKEETLDSGKVVSRERIEHVGEPEGRSHLPEFFVAKPLRTE
jgi:hypothetical protein